MNIKTKRIICLLIGLASVLTIIGTVSYAYFTALGEFNLQQSTLSTGTARVTFSDNDTGIVGELAFGESIIKTFTIENTGTAKAKVKMYWKDLVNTYLERSLTYTLLQADNIDGTYTEVVGKTNVPRSVKPITELLVDSLTIPVGKTYYYKLVITLNNLTDINQEEDLTAELSSSFEIKDINEPETSLPELMVITNTYNEKLWAHKDTIKRIVFETTDTVREGAIYSYDLSTVQDGSIMSYLYPDKEENTKYIAYIQSKEGIKANANSSYLFCSFVNLEQIDNLYYLDTSDVVNMSAMFFGCDNIVSLDLSTFDTSKVTDMRDMFGMCINLVTLNISTFDTSNVIIMHGMFWSCNNLVSLDLRNFDTSRVTTMESMFNGCSGLTSLDLSNFNTSNVTNMYAMFYKCNLASLDLSNFDTSKVTTMESMFSGCSGLASLDLSNFNTSNVINMNKMFYECNLTSLDLRNFDTSNVTTMESMFNGCSGLTSLDLSNFNTSNVTNMYAMFYKCSNLTFLDLKNFDISNVTQYDAIFYLVPSTIEISVSNSTMRQWVIDKSTTPKLTTSNLIY